jgi:hypothetical protein
MDSGRLNIYGNASQLWGKAMETEYALVDALQTVGGALTEGCYTENGNTITYTNCTYGGAGMSETINGTVTIDGDNVTVDLTIDVDYSGNSYHYVWTGSVTVTATSVNGSLNFDMQMNQGGMEYTYNVAIDYNAIVLDGTGCPTGGSFTIDVDVDISGMPSGYGGQSYPGVQVDFGPACGDVTMYSL